MQGGVGTLNLLRFRETADYSVTPELAPETAISGAAAFQRHIEHTLPYLHETGGDLLFIGAGGPFLINRHFQQYGEKQVIPTIATTLKIQSYRAEPEPHSAEQNLLRIFSFSKLTILG